MTYLLTLPAIYFALCIYFYKRNKTKYNYRVSNNLEKLVDFLLIPFMELIATGKDSHWWDYESIDEKAINPNTKLIEIDSGFPQIRKYKTHKYFGQYNLSGLKDLYATLRLLKNVVVLEPKNYTGQWSLVIKGKHKFENNEETYIACKFMHMGKVQNLIDGKKSYLGLTKDGKFIELQKIEITNRSKYRNILFV